MKGAQSCYNANEDGSTVMVIAAALARNFGSMSPLSCCSMKYGMRAAARHAVLDHTSRRQQQQHSAAEASMLEAPTGY